MMTDRRLAEAVALGLWGRRPAADIRELTDTVESAIVNARSLISPTPRIEIRCPKCNDDFLHRRGLAIHVKYCKGPGTVKGRRRR